jgi:hypothetical protein
MTKIYLSILSFFLEINNMIFILKKGVNWGKGEKRIKKKIIFLDFDD